VVPDRVVETIDVAADGLLGIPACFEHGALDEFRLQRLEERLDHGVDAPIPVKAG
jgi:hypothetical protein